MARAEVDRLKAIVMPSPPDGMPVLKRVMHLRPARDAPLAAGTVGPRPIRGAA